VLPVRMSLTSPVVATIGPRVTMRPRVSRSKATSSFAAALDEAADLGDGLVHPVAVDIAVGDGQDDDLRAGGPEVLNAGRGQETGWTWSSGTP
jgi:hypothetical protein